MDVDNERMHPPFLCLWKDCIYVMITPIKPDTLERRGIYFASEDPILLSAWGLLHVMCQHLQYCDVEMSLLSYNTWLILTGAL